MKNFFLAFTSLLCSQWLWAAEMDQSQSSEVQINEAENVSIVKAPTKAIFEGSSEHNRIGKKFSVVAQLFGAGPSNSGSQGLSASYFLSRNTQVLIEAMGNSSNVGFWGSRYEVKTNSAGVHLKHFTGNSFYLRTGIDYRTVDYKYNYNSIFGSDYYVKRSFKGNSLAAALAIGNQWQWGNFTLGCDWIGLSAPVASTVYDEKLEGNIDSYDRNKQEDDRKRFVSD